MVLLVIWVVFILLLLVTQTYLDVLFNSCTKTYDILQTAEDRDIAEFWDWLKIFV